MKAEIYLLQVLLLTVSGWVNRHQQRVIYIFCDTLEVRTEDGMMVGSVQWSGNSLGTSLPPGKELVAAGGASSAPRRPIRSQTLPSFLQDGNDFRNSVGVTYF